MFPKIILVAVLTAIWSQPVQAVDTVFRLDETSRPLAVRVEKAQGLLRAWGFASTEFTEIFRLNHEAGVNELGQAVGTLLTKSEAVTTGANISTEAAHYLTWAMARARILNDLDFSDSALRHFFSVNPRKYVCEPVAKISELVIPATYVETLGSTAILSKIAQRLTQEEFARVAYEFSTKLGTPDTGFLGDVKKEEAGEERFDFYRRAQAAGGTGGPYKAAEGYLFVQVHKLFSEGDDCFLFYRDQVVQDYGREWLKKIYADTLTTAAMQLNLAVNEVTTIPMTTDIAYTVGDHAVSFTEARATLPFLYGDEKTVAFWQSIQRQALEVELIHHSQTGTSIRASKAFREHTKVLALIKEAQRRVADVVAREITTASLEAWYLDNKEQFSETKNISYTLYRCDDSVSTKSLGETAAAPTSAARCAATLEKLAHAAPGAGTPLPAGIVADSQTSETWASRSREIQVACQDLAPGEWSEVFSIDGKPQVLRLDAIDREIPEVGEIWEQVKKTYEIEARTSILEKICVLK